MWQWFLAAAGVLVNIATILVVVVVVRLHLRRAHAAARAPRKGPAAQLDAAGRDAAQLARQLERAIADVDARLDERAEQLRGLLAEANERIAELRYLRDNSASGGDGGPTDPRQAEVVRLATQQIHPVEIARRLAMDVGEVELVLSLSRSVPAERT